MSRALTTFRRLSPAYKAVVGLVAPIGTIVATLLALNVIQPFGEDALAAGVERTSEAATATVNVRYESSPPEGQAIAFTAAGEFDYRARRGRMDYEFTEGAGALDRVEAVFAERDLYLSLPGGGDTWLHADLDVAAEQIADRAKAARAEAPPPELASLGAFDFNDPSQALARLRDASAVEELGEETVFGVATTRYRARLEGDQPLAATAWIDATSLIRRLELTTDEGPAPFTMTMELTEFGKPVDISVPEDVRELDELLAGIG
jgi:hypothetical protein